MLRLAVAGGAGVAVTACGAGDASEPSAVASPSTGSTEPLVRFSNWPGYIDEGTEAAPSTLDTFRSDSGLEVEYTADINDGDEFLAKVRTELDEGRDIGRDIVVFSEETARVFVEEGYAAPLDYALIPNARNLLPRLRSVPFDPDRTYTLPWQSGFTGIGWNTPLLTERLGVDRITSFEQFFDPRLSGRISILSETMDTMGLMLAWQGFDPGDFTDADFEAALATLQTYVDNGQIRQVTGNDYISGLDSGDLIAVMGWSGDVLALGDDYGFALPESGGLVWADSMMVPSSALHKAQAETLMNYYYDPEVAARLAAFIQYVCPVQGAREAMAAIDPTLVDDPWIFPSDAVLSAAYVTSDLSLERAEALDRQFNTVTGA